MGRQALLATLCWLVLSESSGEVANPENSLLVKDNVSAESVPRLYRSVPVGVYASAAPYAAFSYRIPTFFSGPITSASRTIPVKEHAVLNNVNAYLRDSYGNRFVGTPQTAAYKSTIPQQYVQLQALPAHFAEPLAAAAPSHQAKQETPQTAFGSHYRLPFVQASASTNNFAGASQPFVYAQNLRAWTPSTAGHAQFQRLVAPQQQSPSNRALYTQSYRNYHNLNSEPKFQRLEEKFAPLKQIVIENNISQFKEGPSQGDHANLKASPDTQRYTTIVNGKKTIIELETKPSVPLLDLTLLEPLTFDNPVVPQVQHFLPRINQATYKKLPEFNDHQKKSGNQNQKPKPKKKQKRPVDNDDELSQQGPVEPTVIVKGTPNEGPEIIYEIDTPNHKETYKEQSISYNKETNKEPVTYSYDHKDEKKPVSYSYGNIVQKEPVHYSYVSHEPSQNKEAHQNNPAKHLIYTFKPEEQDEDDDQGSINLESEDTGSAEDSDEETHQPHRAEHLEHHQDPQQHEEYRKHHAESPDHKVHQHQHQEYHEQSPKHKLHHPQRVEYHVEPRHHEESQSLKHESHQPEYVEHHEKPNRQEHHSHHEKHQGHHKEPLSHKTHQPHQKQQAHHEYSSGHQPHQPQRIEHKERHEEPPRHNPHQQQHAEHHEHREPSRHNPHQQQHAEHHEHREPSRHNPHQQQHAEHHEYREPSRHNPHQQQHAEHHEHREPLRHNPHQQQPAEYHEHREPLRHNANQQQRDEHHKHPEPSSHNAHKPEFIVFQGHEKSPRHQEHARQEHHQLEYKQRPNGEEYHNVAHAPHKSSPQQYAQSAVEHEPELQAITQEYEEDIRLIPTQGPNAAIQVDPNQHIQKLTSNENPHPSAVPHHQQHYEEHPNHASPHQQQHYEEQQPNHSSLHVPSGPVPIIHETSKRIIIQEETPDEMHSHQEQMLAKMLEEQENNEEDFEKAYKNAAIGFPGYNKDSEDIEKDIYNPNSYGISHEPYEIDHAPFQEYQAEGDEFPKAARLKYKDARDDIKNDYFVEYAVHKPESIADRYKKKKEYYKLYDNYKPEKYFADEKKEKQKDKYTLAPSFSYHEPAKEENKNKPYFAQYKAAPPKYQYSYSKPKARDNSAFDSRPYQSYTSKTHFVEPQFQYGFEPIAIPRLLDSELAAMASNDSPESDKPGMRKKVYKENWYIKKTSTAGGDAAS